MLPNLKETNKVVGTKQARRAITNDLATRIYVAKDADAHVVKDIIQLCKTKDIKLIHADSKRELGKACGIDVSASAVAVLK